MINTPSATAETLVSAVLAAAVRDGDTDDFQSTRRALLDYIADLEADRRGECTVTFRGPELLGLAEHFAERIRKILQDGRSIDYRWTVAR